MDFEHCSFVAVLSINDLDFHWVPGAAGTVCGVLFKGNDCEVFLVNFYLAPRPSVEGLVETPV